MKISKNNRNQRNYKTKWKLWRIMEIMEIIEIIENNGIYGNNWNFVFSFILGVSREALFVFTWKTKGASSGFWFLVCFFWFRLKLSLFLLEKRRVPQAIFGFWLCFFGFSLYFLVFGCVSLGLHCLQSGGSALSVYRINTERLHRGERPPIWRECSLCI